MIAVLVLAACIAGSASAAFAATVFSGTLDASSPVMGGRVDRNGAASTCAAVKAFPADLVAAGTQYQTHVYVHSGAARCVTFTYSSSSCGTSGASAFVSIYNGAFDPTNRRTNYLGDIGTSAVGSKMGIMLATGQSVTLVVNGTQPGLNCAFTVDSDDPVTQVFTASLSGAPLMTDPIITNGTPSACASAKPFPGGTGPGDPFIQYRTTTYTSVGSSQCVTFTVTGGTCGANSLAAVYNDPFDPNNKATNYLGDTGSPGIGQSMGVNLGKGAAVKLVVMGLGPLVNCTTIISSDEVFTATHDINGDRMSDIVWRQNTGATSVWMMNGAKVSTSGSLGTVPPNWQLVGQRDFNGDGTYDWLWRDTSTGTVAIWLMNGLQVSQSAALGAVPNNWIVAGTLNLFSLRGDILWRDTSSGAVAIWPMNGLIVQQPGSLGVVGLNWTIIGTDGKNNIVWRDSNTGTVAVWALSGFTVTQTTSLGVVPSNWSLVGVGDFDANGSSDLLWRDSTTGTVAIWLMFLGRAGWLVQDDQKRSARPDTRQSTAAM